MEDQTKKDSNQEKKENTNKPEIGLMQEVAVGFVVANKVHNETKMPKKN